MKRDKNTVALYVDKDLVNLYKASLPMYEALKGVKKYIVENSTLSIFEGKTIIAKIDKALAEVK